MQTGGPSKTAVMIIRACLVPRPNPWMGFLYIFGVFGIPRKSGGVCVAGTQAKHAIGPEVSSFENCLSLRSIDGLPWMVRVEEMAGGAALLCRFGRMHDRGEGMAIIKG